MPTIQAGSSADVTVAAGKALKVSADGEAVVHRLSGLPDAPYSSDRVLAGVREYQKRDLPFAVRIAAISGSVRYEVKLPDAQPGDILFRRNDGGGISAVVDAVSGRSMPISVGRPLDRNINATGDSRTKNSIGTSGGVLFENYGHGAHYGFLTGGRVRISPERLSATPGHTSAQWLANMQAYIAAGGDVFMNLISVNDRLASNNFSLTRSKRNVETGLRMQLDAGKIPIVIAELPTFGGSALTGQQLINHLAMREWFLERMPDFGIRVSDPWPLLTEADFVDGLHPAQPGALKVAKTVAPHLIDLYGAPLSLPTYDEQYDATYAPGGWLTANPLLLGTTGTLSASANGTGPVADGWNVAGSAWTGATVRCFKETNPDGGEFQCFELGGTPTSAGSTLLLQYTMSLENLSASDVIRGLAKTVWEGLSGVGGVSIDFRVADGATTYYKSLDRYAEGWQMAPGPEAGPQETPYLTITGTETEIKLRAVIYGCQNVPIRGIVKVGNFAPEKVLSS